MLFVILLVILIEINLSATLILLCKFTTIFLCAADCFCVWFRINNLTEQQISGINSEDSPFRTKITLQLIEHLVQKPDFFSAHLPAPPTTGKLLLLPNSRYGHG